MKAIEAVLYIAPKTLRIYDTMFMANVIHLYMHGRPIYEDTWEKDDGDVYGDVTCEAIHTALPNGIPIRESDTDCLSESDEEALDLAAIITSPYKLITTSLDTMGLVDMLPNSDLLKDYYDAV